MSTIKADNISPVGSILNLTAPVAGLSVASGLTVGGVAYFSGGATFAGTTDHSGVARFSGGVTASQIYGSGGSTFAGNLHVVGGVTFAGTSDHTGVARFAAGVTMSSSLDVNGTLKVSGQITHGSAPVAVPSGTAPIFGCRAWVNFDGTRDHTGAVSTANTNRLIRASGNVTSVLRNGTGDYTVNFTTAMPDANYAFVGTSSDNNDDSVGPVAVGAKSTASYVPTTTGRRFETAFNNINYDSTFCSVVIFR